LQKKLQKWEEYLNSFEDIISIRAAYYQPLLPDVESQFRALDSKMKLRVEQRDRLDKRLKKMLVSPRPEFLATVDERLALEKLDNLQNSLPADADDKLRARIERLRGVISWNIDTQYQDRFTQANKHLRELDTDVEKLHTIYDSFVRTRQAATQSYRGYDAQLKQLRIKIRHGDDAVKLLMARQGHMIEVMAINELELRRKRLEEYQVKARFAMAESYDRATKAQQEQVIEKSTQ
jgi:chromosome segregation ATPase